MQERMRKDQIDGEHGDARSKQPEAARIEHRYESELLPRGSNPAPRGYQQKYEEERSGFYGKPVLHLGYRPSSAFRVERRVL